MWSSNNEDNCHLQRLPGDISAGVCSWARRGDHTQVGNIMITTASYTRWPGGTTAATTAWCWGWPGSPPPPTPPTSSSTGCTSSWTAQRMSACPDPGDNNNMIALIYYIYMYSTLSYYRQPSAKTPRRRPQQQRPRKAEISSPCGFRHHASLSLEQWGEMTASSDL